MPTLSYPISEVANQIIDPIIQQLTLGFLKTNGIKPYIDDNYIHINTDRSSSDVTTDKNGRLSSNENRVDVDTDIVLNPSVPLWEMNNAGNNASFGITRQGYNDIIISAGSNSTNRKGFSKGSHVAIYNDRSIGTFIEEFTQLFGVTLTLKITTNGYDLAQRFYSTLSAKYFNDQIYEIFDLFISYPFDTGLQAICALIYRCKHNICEDAKIKLSDVIQYVKDYSKSDIGYRYQLNDLQGGELRNRQLVLRRGIKDVPCLVTHDSERPEVERIEKAPFLFTTTVTLKMQIEIPTFLLFGLPIVIHNVALPEILFRKKTENMTNFPSIYSKPQLDLFDRVMQKTITKFPGTDQLVRYPIYDDWLPPNVLVNNDEYSTLLILTVTLDEGDMTCISFNDMDEYRLSPFMCELLQMHQTEDLLNGDGIFRLLVFANDGILVNDLVTFDQETLSVAFKATNKRPIYRIVLAERINILSMNMKWYPTVLRYRFLFPLTLARSTNYLHDKGFVTYVPDQSIYLDICKIFHSEHLYAVLRTMMKTGKVPHNIYQFTQNANQFACYIMQTKAYSRRDAATEDPDTNTHLPGRLDKDPEQVWYMKTNDGIFYSTKDYCCCCPPNPSIETMLDSVETLYDVFMKACMELKIIHSYRPQSPLSLGNADGIPYYVPEKGGLNGFNSPLRIVNYNVYLEYQQAQRASS